MDRRIALAVLASLVASSALAQVVEPRVVAVEPFDTLAVDGVGRVRLFQADRDEVVVPGDRRLIDGVAVRREGTTLTLVLPRALGELSQVEVRARHVTRVTLAGGASVSAPLSFKTDRLALHMTGSGFAIFDALETGELAVDLAGSAEARLAGKVDKLRLTASGGARCVSDRLRARSVAVAVGERAGADVWAVDELEAHVSQSGRVRFWGRPVVQRTITEHGSIDDRGRR